MNIVVRKLCLILLGLTGILALPVFSQNTVIEELQAKLASIPSDTAKVDLYNKLSWEFHRVNIDRSFFYAKQALALGEQVNYLKGIGRAYNLMGICHDFRGERQKAVEANKITLALGHQLADSFLLSIAYNDLAILTLDKEEVLEGYQKSLVYTLHDDILGQVFSLSNIGFLHLEEGHDELGKQYLKDAVKLAGKADDHMSLSLANLSMGSFYKSESVADSAIFYYQKALDIAAEANDLHATSQCLIALGDVYTTEKQYEVALESYDRAIFLTREMENYIVLHTALLSKANTYTELGRYSKAKESALEGFDIIQGKGYERFRPKYLELLATICAKLGDYEQAFAYQTKLLEKRDTLFQREKQEIYAEVEGRYQLERKESENKRLLAEQQKDALSIRSRNLIILLCGLALVSIIGLLFHLKNANQTKKRFNDQLKKEVAKKTADLSITNAELKRINEELASFNFIASHDLKEPIRNIVNFIQLSKRGLENKRWDEVYDYFYYIEQGAHQLYHLIQDVLEFSRLGKKKIVNREVDLNMVMDQVKFTLTKPIAEKKAIIQNPTLPLIHSSESHLFLVLKNLVENAIKYNESECPTIFIEYQIQDENHLFKVIDNGIGIDQSFSTKIFEMFTRLHNRNEYHGSGLGLAICKKIVEALGGRIWVENNQPQGSAFFFTVPVVDEPDLVQDELARPSRTKGMALPQNRKI